MKSSLRAADLSTRSVPSLLGAMWMASRACGMKDEHMFVPARRIPDFSVAPASPRDGSCHPNGWVRGERGTAAARAYQHLSPAARARLTPPVPCADSDRFRDVSGGRLAPRRRAR